MNTKSMPCRVGDTELKHNPRSVMGDFVQLFGERYYRIANSDQMPTFFLSLVSGSDHWLFISSNGGLTAGRVNPDSALFPYETEDKIAVHHEATGSKTIIRVIRNDQCRLWEPFSNRHADIYRVQHSVYKNVAGNKLVFEVVNHDLGVTLRQSWQTSERFGFVRRSWLRNHGESPCQIQLLDGVQNVLPFGVTAALQRTSSNLLNAYKRNELDPDTGAGLFTLSATLTDRAEPSESLKATVVWQVGLDVTCYLLSSQQLDAFRQGRQLVPEHDVRGRPGSYLVTAQFDLAPAAQQQWDIAADVNQDRVAISRLQRFLQQDSAAISEAIEVDIARLTRDLVRFVAAADGLQQSAQESTVVHHYANVLFNIMRGGIFADGYRVTRADLLDFVAIRNRNVLRDHRRWFESLPDALTIRDLYAAAAGTQNPDLVRLCYEFLPLTFSRRHGDPSRPWNNFSINLRKADGTPNLDYQGNWRDIFQNWEPLALAFPAYSEGMIAKFLNATTADGYNPYRVTRDGIEWEVVEPDNPWSNIGYWSDHQIIYLQKLLEIAEQVHPGELARLWNQPLFAYANVPYRLRSYAEMLLDWYTTIDFDDNGDAAIERTVSRMGSDGRLMLDDAGAVIHVTMVEKLLVLLLAKLVNLVPDGGIWMNTQRPEWNDANNALVGKGLSVVTVGYLRRFIAFWQDQLTRYGTEHGGSRSFAVNADVASLFTAVQTILDAHRPILTTGFTPEQRRGFMDELGSAATAYRDTLYQNGIPEARVDISAETLTTFLTLAQSYVEQTLYANRRPDGLGHTYNILRLDEDRVTIDPLYLMLEGQVGYLSSGLLSAEEALNLLTALRHSALYRADQHSYMLYPNRELAGFLQKNNVAAKQVADSDLVAALQAAGDTRLLAQDDAGVFHFNGRFRNANDVADVLAAMAQEPEYSKWVAAERTFILDLFESTFNHSAFTGRSGTFFAYEGLGSIYWHMVSKLLLAAQECYQQAVDDGQDAAITEALAAAYYDIRAGLGFNKAPDVYGAFPTDPYSHTPIEGGASQPGMTGLVKEEILTRWGELGVRLQRGVLCFTPTLLREDEYLKQALPFDYVTVTGEQQRARLPAGSVAFTICQVPVIYQRGDDASIELVYSDGRTSTVSGSCLDTAATQSILNRDGRIAQLRVTVTQ